MKKIPSIAILSFVVFVNWNCAAQQKEKGWKYIFDGKTTNGWHTYGKENAGAAWSVEDGALHFNPSSTTGRGDLITNKEYSNFDLRLDWKIAPAGNSGIIFLVHEDPAKYSNTYSTGPEMQVLDNKEAEDRKNEKHLAGVLYDLIGSRAISNPKPAGEWNHAEIKVNKGKLTLTLNGTIQAETTMWTDDWKKLIAGSKFKDWLNFGNFKKGHIALQDHGSEVWFKNIRIKEL